MERAQVPTPSTNAKSENIACVSGLWKPSRQRFGLDAERWAAFQAALDAPARPNLRLKKLLQTSSVFERRRK